MDALLSYITSSLGPSNRSGSQGNAGNGTANHKKPNCVKSPEWAGCDVPVQHHLVYEKMENLLVRMQNKTDGIKSRSPDNNDENYSTLTFTGSDLIEWIKKNMSALDEDEALLLSNSLYTYGYVLPIDDRKPNFKNDGTLYCFQSNFYYPSQWPNPNDREYAVYLCQRAMRKITQLILSEHESSILTAFKNSLNKKWLIVLTESTLKVLVSKRQCKKETQFSDSRERAFWDVHRPQPGVVNTTEIDIKKLKKVLKEDFTKEKDASLSKYETFELSVEDQTLQSLEEEIASLHLALGKIQADASRVSELYIKRYERYTKYDPFLCGQDPSNHWTSKYTGEWPSAKMNEITAFRVHRWSFDIRELLIDPVGKQHFTKFLEKEFSDENMRFLDAVKSYKNLPKSSMKKAAYAIWHEYFDSEILNIDSQSKLICKNDMLHCHTCTFDEIAMNVYQLLKNDSYQRYIRSDMYKEYLNDAPKKKTSKKGIKSLLSYSGRRNQE